MTVVSAPADARKVPRGCAWAIVVAGGLLLMMGGLSLVAIPFLWKRAQEVWTETQGTLVESYLKNVVRRSSARDGSGRDHDTYDVRLKYRYQVDGKDHSGDEKAMRQPVDDENWREAKTVQESYKSGEAIPVYYRPRNPAKSRFTAEEPAIEFKKDIFLLAGYLLGGGALVVWGRKMLRPADADVATAGRSAPPPPI
jgi:hypothetical protein